MKSDRHTINLGGEVWAELQKYAEGFDTPEDVLRKLLGLEPSARKKVRDPEVKDLWVLHTDPDLEEIAIRFAEGIEQQLGDEYQDQIEDRVVSNFGDEIIPEDQEEGSDAFNRYVDLMAAGQRAVIDLVTEHLMSAYKMPGSSQGGEDGGETPTSSG